MSAPATTATESRRRFPAWKRSTASAKGESPRRPPAAKRPREPRRPAEYAPDARPERQGALATIVPTRPLRMAVLIAGIALVTASTIGLGSWSRPLEALERLAGPRFARTIPALRDCIDPRGGALPAFLAESFLLAAAAVALSVRGMRRHRRDGRHGRARAWGTLALVLATAALASRVPVGRLVSTLLADATGRTFGPDGNGWWIATAGVASVIVGMWAILPLHQRLMPGLWLFLGLAAWGIAAAAPALAGAPAIASRGIDVTLVAPAAWLVGAAALWVATLVAARGVIREVRGEIKAAPVPAAPQAAARGEADRSDEEPAQEPVFEPVATAHDAAPAAERSDAGYTDGSDLEDDYASRPLSKAERKRLRKLAKSGQAA